MFTTTAEYKTQDLTHRMAADPVELTEDLIDLAAWLYRVAHVAGVKMAPYAGPHGRAFDHVLARYPDLPRAGRSRPRC